MDYGFSNQANNISHFIKHSDNNIYMVGYVDDTLQTNADILLIKVDTAGNEIWKKKIGVTGMDENAYSIDTLQGDLIIAGNRIIHNTSSTDGFVMRLDTAGNTIWQKIIYTNGGYSGSKAKRLKDGNILVYSRLKMYDVGSDSYYKLKTEKITPNNITIWQKSYSSIGVESDYYTALENSQGQYNHIGQPYQNTWLVKTDSLGCDSASCYYLPTGFIHSNSVENSFEIYPNPNTGNAILNLKEAGITSIGLKVYDVNGRVVFEDKVTDTVNKNYELNTELKSGIYFVEVIDTNTEIIYKQKLVIQK